MVAGIEEGVGAVVAELEAQGVLEDTIIAFSIDNGGVPYAGALNYPLRGAKTTLFEGGVRSPGFLHAPRLLPSQDFSPLFHVADYLPTLLSLVDKAEGVEEVEVKEGVERNEGLEVTSVRLDGVDQVGAMVGSQGAARTAVHIHRDYDRDGHAYRRGAWKVIVGHHCLPFYYTKVYNESHSRWIDESGGVRGKVLQLLQEAVDLVVGTENATFLHYFLWILFDSFNVGGLADAQSSAGGMQDGKIVRSTYPTDLDHFLSLQQTYPNLPLVSLFNLEEDPSESTNQASQHPGLVRELLAEAEAALVDAPLQVRGDMVDADSPMGPDQKAWGGWWSLLLTLGSQHSKVIPYGPYLADDFDYTELQFVRLLTRARWDSLVVFIKVCLVFLGLPLLLLVLLVRFLR